MDTVVRGLGIRVTMIVKGDSYARIVILGFLSRVAIGMQEV